jgi:hypothetical protein
VDGQPLEKEIVEDCVLLYRTAGCEVMRIGQAPRRTKQTPGIPDLKVYCRSLGLTWWHEVKRPKGRQSKVQREIQELAESCGEVYLLGGYEVAIDRLRELKLMEGYEIDARRTRPDR